MITQRFFLGAVSVKIPCLMYFDRGESHIGHQVEFCQQSDVLWARGDEKNFPGNKQKRDATIVVAIPAIALVLIESNDVGVSEIVRKTSSIPAYREYAEKHR